MIDFEDYERQPCQIDEASQTEARFLKKSLDDAARMAKVKRMPKSPGLCDVCEEPVTNPQQLFCCTDCRDQDAKEEQMYRITGKRRVL